MINVKDTILLRKDRRVFQAANGPCCPKDSLEKPLLAGRKGLPGPHDFLTAFNLRAIICQIRPIPINASPLIHILGSIQKAKKRQPNNPTEGIHRGYSRRSSGITKAGR